MQYCPNCKQPLSRAAKWITPEDDILEVPARRRHTPVQRIMICLAVVLCVAALIVGAYKLVFWANNYRITRLYTRGEYTPTVNTLTMDDGRVGHVIVFYGEDGDQVFLPELQKSLSISGGVARVSIADADWFSGDVTDVEGASVCLSPVLYDEAGKRTQLPAMNFTVDVPDSPLTIVSPAKERTTIVTALYLLQLRVVPGSTVLVNGEDVTDMVDRSGLLSKNVNVYPVGDNVFSIIVRTQQHHETRRDITIRREAYDIDFELSTTVENISSNKNMTVSGTIEPGAQIVVETAYIEDSMQIDPETGKFSFIAQLSNYGENTIRFRVTMEGRQDAAISLNVEYVPTRADYVNRAWAMDYAGLRQMYEQWNGRAFKCEGALIDIVSEDDATYLILNVGTSGEQQLLILENKSSMTDFVVGRRYTAYADVSGRNMYKSQYYPMLTIRYIDYASNQ